MYLPLRFMQMILAAKVEKPPYIKTSLEQLILADGDFIDMEWTGVHERSAIYSQEEEHRIALVWGNVNGSNNDTYSRHTIEELYRSGFRTAFVHYRNARLASKPEPNNFMTYTNQDDMHEVIKYVHEKYPKARIYLVGMSMGGNMCVRYLENHKKEKVKIKNNVRKFLRLKD